MKIDADILNSLVGFVDILVVIVTAAMLAYGVDRGLLRKRSPLPLGAYLICAGMALAVVAHLGDTVYRLYSAPIGSKPVSNISSTAGIEWLLSRTGFALVVTGLLVGVVYRRRSDQMLKSGRAELDSLRASGHDSDRRFRHLFNNTSNSVCCLDFKPPIAITWPTEQQIALSIDATLSECNGVFAHQLGAELPSEVIGRRLRFFDSSNDAEAHGEVFARFIEGGYQLDNHEVNYVTSSGERQVSLLSLEGIVCDSRLERIWAVAENISEFRSAQEELRHRQRFQELLASVSGRLLRSTYALGTTTVHESMTDIGQFIGAERSAIFWLDDLDKNNLVPGYATGVWGKELDSRAISLEMFPEIKRRLLQKKHIRIDAVASLPAEFETDKAHLQSINLKALLVLPLVVDGELVGAMTFSRLGSEQPWSDDDAQFGAVFSELLANFVLRLNSHRALQDALDDVRQASDRLEAENLYLREEVELNHGFDEIVGESTAILQSLSLVEQVAGTETPVLILGETGTGKELIARAIHRLSARSERSLVKVNCAALPASLIENELFGHEKGAFTGADSSKRGRFDLANGSTLFLDEIGEIPIELQAKLLRVLQEGEFERVGGTKTIRINTRIVAATNRNLEQAVRKGEFRADLYYRINTFPINLPPLRDRDNDIELLARYFIGLHATRLGKDVHEVSAETMRQLRAYHWPGNVRELEGIIQRALISSSGSVVELAEPLISVSPVESIPRIVRSSISKLTRVERDHIVSVLGDSNWTISGTAGAAAQLGLPPSTLRSKMKKLGIVRPT